MKENIDANKEKNIKKEKKINSFKFNKKFIILLVTIILIVLICVGIVFLVQHLKYSKYKHYEEKMNSYGFNRLYDNESAKTSEKVTKSEAIKMAIGACLNRFNIDGIANKPTEDYQNAIWVLYAQDMELVNATDLNKDTASQNAKYVEVINYFAAIKQTLLTMELNNDTSKNIDDLDKYSETEQKAILDMLSNDILKVVENNLNGSKDIFKGQLNEIVVNYIEKYNLLDDKIQTDESKLPKNASDFAYISQDVAKEIYEIPYDDDGTDNLKLPKIVFSDLKKYYNSIVEKAEEYYNTILNVDYTTIDKQNLKDTLYSLMISSMGDSDYEEYVNYVKTNQIKITGKAAVQKPIIYYDGLNYRLRLKLDFNIENSLTNENILLYDLVSGEKVTYNKKNYSTIVDVRIISAYGTGTYYIKQTTIDSIKVQ